jgi:hypothetical protein
MPLDKTSSERLQLLRYPLIVGVVFVHATPRMQLADAREPWDLGCGINLALDLVQALRLAIPLFFLMAGYFLFLDFSWSFKNYAQKLKSRFRTLLVPFLFWTHLVLLTYFVFQQIPAFKVYFSGNRPSVANLSFYGYFDALLGFSASPFAFQFWFIRDLIILVILCPVIYLLLKKPLVALFSLLFLFSVYFTDFWPLIFPKFEAIFFFFIGSAFAVHKKSLFLFDKKGIFIVILYCSLVALDILSRGWRFNVQIHTLGMVVGVPAVLFLTKKVAEYEKLKSWLHAAAGSSFFLFAVHEPALSLLRKVFSRNLPKTWFFTWINYFLPPLLIIGFAMGAFYLLRIIAPAALRITTGGREAGK